jgi:S1-C subfamily serine protease
VETSEHRTVVIPSDSSRRNIKSAKQLKVHRVITHCDLLIHGYFHWVLVVRNPIAWLALFICVPCLLGQSSEFKSVKAKAERGEVESQYQLAVMYALGIGVPKNYAESGKWYLKAANAGVAEAQFALGLRYYKHGLDAKEHYATAFTWFYKAANQGMPEAQYNLGVLYSLGRGVATNKVEAFRWFNLAGAQGNTNGLVARLELEDELTPKQIRDGETRAAAFVPKRTFKPQLGALEDSGPEPKASGTGFFITEDGYLVTNHHVVDDAHSYAIRTSKGRLPARIVRTDEKDDVAVLKVDGSFSALPVSSNGTARLGESVFTIGFPFLELQGTKPKLTRGEISSLAGMKDDPRYFQISVPVQPGNSGGPLVNSSGEVVGVVTMRLGDLGTLRMTGALPQNVNYALKASHVRQLIDAIPEAKRSLKDSKIATERPFDDVVKEVESAVAIILAY